MLVGEAAPSGPVGRKVLASRASQFFASAEGVHEKPRIQALRRSSGYVETDSGAVVRVMKNTYKRNDDWLAQYEGLIHFHFTPTSASWLNQIEIWFGLLTRKALRGESFSSKDQLRSAIEAFVVKTNEPPKPFHWRQREVKGSQLRHTLVSFCN